MRKKIIAFLLVAVIVIGITPLMSLAEESDTVTAVRGDTTYALTADPDTGTVPDGFGTVSNNGRIWTDKSVEVVDDRFNVNLQVLAQEYVSTAGSGDTVSIAADVVMIFDFTSSMNDSITKEGGGSVTRLEALTDAANEAIEIITSTNQNNRIVVYGYSGGSNNAKSEFFELLPLGHYTSSSAQQGTSGKYLVYSSNTVKTSTTLLKDGVPVPSSSHGTSSSGTCIQYGVARGIDGLIESISNETDNTVKRKPYVILMTDGEPTWASRNWSSDDEGQLRTNTITPTSNNNRQSIATAIILTSALKKDKLEAAYDAYNGRHFDAEWFNIGIGLDDVPDSAYAQYACPSILMNPNHLVGVNPVANSSDHREATKYLLGVSWAAPAYTAKDYSADDNYVYVNSGDGYVTFANTYNVLMTAFTTLAQIIQQGSMEITFPIIIHEGSGEQASDVVFTDVLGEGMYVTGVTLTPDGEEPVEGVDEGNGTFTFGEFETTVTVTEGANGQQTLVWRLPAKEVAMFTFADRENVLNGQYNTANPTKLTYGIDFTAEVDEGPAFTNAFDSEGVPLTTVTYEIPGDNNYYFDIVLDNLANFVSSTIKTDVNESTPKTENITESAANSSEYVYTSSNDGTIDSYAAVEGKLGNNGKVTFLERKENVEITVEKKWEDRTGEPITDTSNLPPVTVELCRTIQNSNEEEVIATEVLSDSDGYTADYTLPARNSENQRYIYYIREDCPDGYYTLSTSPPLSAEDGTLTVTNREFPENGIISLRKLWVDKVGATISGSSLQPIEANLMRHVTAYTPAMRTVTITCTDSNNNTVILFDNVGVEKGTDIKFKIKASATSGNNASNAVIKLNGTTVDSYRESDNVSGIGTVWYRKTELQTITVNEDMTLAFTVNKAFNTNANLTKKADFEGDPDYISANGGIDPVTLEYDEAYETVTLNNFNNWSAVFENVPIMEVINGTSYSYKYYADEITDVPGFTASYSDNNSEGIEGGVLVITNTSTSAIGILPETGGRGSPPIVLTGAVTVMFAMAFMFTGLSPGRRKRHRKRTI